MNRKELNGDVPTGGNLGYNNYDTKQCEILRKNMRKEITILYMQNYIRELLESRFQLIQGSSCCNPEKQKAMENWLIFMVHSDMLKAEQVRQKASTGEQGTPH